MTPFEWVVILVALIIRGIYRLLTGAAAKEREEERRWQEQLRKQEAQRRHEDELRRKIVEDAKQQFEECVMGFRFPSDEVLAILADCDSEIPINLKEAVEEAQFGTPRLPNVSPSLLPPRTAQGARSRSDTCVATILLRLPVFDKEPR